MGPNDNDATVVLNLAENADDLRPKVPTPTGIICMVTGDNFRYAESAAALSRLNSPPGTDVYWGVGSSVAHNLNKCTEKAMSSPTVEWVWYMGDDHTYSPDILNRLLARNKDIIAPLVTSRAPPFGYIAFKEEDEIGHFVPWKPQELPLEGGLIKCAGIAGAGLLVRRNVLEKLGKPWFELGRTHKGSDQLGEDLWFCHKATEAGYELWTDLDIRMGHMTHMNLIPGYHQSNWGTWIHLGNGTTVFAAHKAIEMNKTSGEEFEKWRTGYATFTDDEHRAWYRRIEAEYPAQVHGSTEGLTDAVMTAATPRQVVEIGGWKGNHAKILLARYRDISSWTNIEFCAEAAKQSVCADERYKIVIPDEFRWWTDAALEGDVAILSHTIEHLNDDDAMGLLVALKSLPVVYIEAPLSLKGHNNWFEHTSTHILTWSWETLDQVMDGLGYGAIRKSTYSVEDRSTLYHRREA